jgi:hypothetical protein
MAVLHLPVESGYHSYQALIFIEIYLLNLPMMPYMKNGTEKLLVLFQKQDM